MLTLGEIHQISQATVGRLDSDVAARAAALHASRLAMDADKTLTYSGVLAQGDYTAFNEKLGLYDTSTNLDAPIDDDAHFVLDVGAEGDGDAPVPFRFAQVPVRGVRFNGPHGVVVFDSDGKVAGYLPETTKTYTFARTGEDRGCLWPDPKQPGEYVEPVIPGPLATHSLRWAFDSVAPAKRMLRADGTDPFDTYTPEKLAEIRNGYLVVVGYLALNANGSQMPR